MLVIPTAFLDDTEGVEDLGEAPVGLQQLHDEVCKWVDRYSDCSVKCICQSRVGEEGCIWLDQPFVFRLRKETSVKPELRVDFLHSRNQF